MRALLIVLLLLALGAGAALLYFRQEAPEPEPQNQVPPSVSPTLPYEKKPAPEPEQEPVTGPEQEVAQPATEPVEPPAEPLPALGQSDAAAISAAADLLGEDVVIHYLVNDALIARAVATIDSLSARQVPGNVMALQSPSTEFQADADDWPETLILNAEGDAIEQYTSSPENHQRYTPYVEMLEALDVEQTLAAYDQYGPLFQEAYSQLGYAEGSFDGRLIEVIDELLATPEVQEPVQLKKPEAFYLYVDEDLESLTAGQKALIRMGPDNASRVKAKLQEFRLALLETN